MDRKLLLNNSTLPAIAKNTWTTLAPMPTSRRYLACAACNNKIYAVGGFNNNEDKLATNECYNIKKNTWTTKASIPAAVDTTSLVTVGNYIYAMGGSNGSVRKLYCYNVTNDSWSEKADMSYKWAVGTALVGRKIYCIGGWGEKNLGVSDGKLSVNEYFDVDTNTWTTKTNMPTARERLGVANVNDKLYCIGGGGGSSYGPLATNECYMPSTDTWTTKANMPTARLAMGCQAIGTNIYCFGGGKSTTSYLSTNECYNVTTNTWTTKANMPSAVSYGGNAQCNGRIYHIGGYIYKSYNGATTNNYNYCYKPD